MNCRVFHSIIRDLARSEVTDKATSCAALIHLERCDRCRSVLAIETSLMASLSSLAESTEHYDAPGYLEGRLRAAFRARLVVLPGTRSSKERGFILCAGRSMAKSPWTWGLAAAMLAVFALIQSVPKAGFWSGRPDGIAIDRVAQATNSQSQIENNRRGSALRDSDPETRSAVARRQPFSGSSLSARKSNPVRDTQSRLERRSTGQHAREAWTDFLPLTYEGDPVLLEGSQLVQVKMSRSMLISFGLPMNVERGSEPIQAEVLIGLDGCARAIRFMNLITPND